MSIPDLSHIRMSKRDRELAENLLKKIPQDGTIGNSNLRNQLSWKKERYQRIRGALIAYGFITTGKGHGGSVMHVTKKSSKKDTRNHNDNFLGHSFADLDEEDQKFAKELLKKVPQDGAKIGNSNLRAELNWEDDRYWKIRNALIDYGLLETGKGKGGSVGRILSIAQDKEDDGKEHYIYQPINKMLYEMGKGAWIYKKERHPDNQDCVSKKRWAMDESGFRRRRL